jgi:ribonuclease Z
MNQLHRMAADPWSTNEVHCLGVAAGWPCRERRHSCYLYRLGAQWVMVDCGAGSSGAWREAGLGPDDLDHLFLSHQHSDHVGGFSMLIQGFWVEKRRKPLTVHAPAGAIPLLRAWLEATILFDELIGFPIVWQPLESGISNECGDSSVTPFPTTHLSGLECGFGARHEGTPFSAFSFSIRTGGLRLAHTADIGAVADLEPLLAEPLDLMVCELAHVDADELLDRLASARIGELVLVHLERRWWDDRVALLRMAGERLPGVRCSVARDGDRYRIGG